MLEGKKIIVGISGSIAAYKAAHLVRLLVKAGAEVRVIMTPDATKFIAPLTLGTLAKSRVMTELFTNEEWENHALLGRWADVMVIAPATCNTIAKMAHALCDNLLLSVYLSATCPVMVCPAMDEDMWQHPATRQNVLLLEQYGNKVLGVGHGELASGLTGPGRMQEPEAIVEALEGMFTQTGSLAGKKVLVTAGPTYEKLDPVRFIGNNSSGKMGLEIAKEAKQRGAEVVLVLGPNSLEVPAGLTTIHVTSAAEMLEACTTHFPGCHYAILSAAVADFTPVHVAAQKIKKGEDDLQILLTRTVDILKTLGARKQSHQTLVGFALETENEAANARKKLKSKNADFIILNSLRDAGAGFGGSTNKITIFDKNGQEYAFELKSKAEVAKDIWNTIALTPHA